jgi:hypothetical protein
MRVFLAALAACFFLAAPAEARGRLAPECNVSMPCIGASQGSSHRGRHYARGSVSLNGVVAPLAAKVRAIQAACRSTKIISTIRHTLIAGGGGAISKHASGRAVDVSGNYRCIYAQLRDWPSYSIDGPRCRHVHISVGESRFRHYRC